MENPFFERLEQRSRDIDSLLCVGLDPHISQLSQPSAAGARDFCLRLIEATAPYTAAFKPNSAFFEVFGSEGFAVLQEVIAAVPDDIPVLLDAKRGDIGSTSQAYAQAAFDTLQADAMTVSPYLGRDAVEPFLTDPAKGIFLLCKTSNPGASDLQDVETGGRPLYLHVANLAQNWNTKGNVGLVVGATYPEQLAQVRAAVPTLWFLLPGVGAQGADLQAAVSAGLREDGLGLLISVSRGISQAEYPAEAARSYRDQINAARQAKQPAAPSFPHKQLANDLLKLGCVKFGNFTLKSGQSSPIYLDLRRLVGDSGALARAAAAYAQLLHPLQFDRLAALPYAALPIGAAITLQTGKPLIYPRKEVKEYGTKSAVEGPYAEGETAVVIDDLVTTGESKYEGIEKLTAAGLKVTDIVVLINRQAANVSNFAERGFKLHAVLDLPELLDHWKSTGAISSEQYSQVQQYLQSA